MGGCGQAGVGFAGEREYTTGGDLCGRTARSAVHRERGSFDHTNGCRVPAELADPDPLQIIKRAGRFLRWLAIGLKPSVGSSACCGIPK